MTCEALSFHSFTRPCVFITAWLILLQLGCHTEPAQEVILEATDLENTPGMRGSLGVERVTRTYRVRVDDRLQTHLYLPVDASGIRQKGPVAVVVQGGAVEARRYEWLARHLSSKGYVTVLAEHASNLSFFEEGNSVAALEAITHDPEFEELVSNKRGVVLGHSLGGVTASTLWLDHPTRFSTLVLMASEAKSWDDFSKRRTPADKKDQDLALVIASSEDGRIESQRIFDNTRAIADAGTAMASISIQGMIHMQWTTDVTPEELEDDGTPTITDELARQRALVMIDLALEQGVDAVNEPDAQWPEDVLRLEDAPEVTP